MTRDWLLPRGPKESAWWAAFGVVAHVALVVLVAVTIRRSFPSEPVVVVLLPGEATVGEVEMPWAGGRADGRTGRRADGPTGRRADGRVLERTAPVVVPDTVPPVRPSARPTVGAFADGVTRP